MKFLSYNILSGGFKEYFDQSPKPERLKLLQQVIKQVNADFVTLIDTHRWTEIYQDKDLIKLFNYRHTYLVKLEDQRLIEKGHDNGICVLTNLPVTKYEKIRLHNRNAIKTEIKINHQLIDIFSIYLDDLSENTRLLEIKSLFKLINPKKPTIFMGDLNTLKKVNIFKWTFNFKFKLAFELISIIKDMSQGEVFKFISQNHFTDTNQKHVSTAPSKLYPVKYDQAIIQIDYIFYNQFFKLNNFEVLTGELYDQTSDHFPITANLEIIK